MKTSKTSRGIKWEERQYVSNNIKRTCLSCGHTVFTPQAYPEDVHIICDICAIGSGWVYGLARKVIGRLYDYVFEEYDDLAQVVADLALLGLTPKRLTRIMLRDYYLHYPGRRDRLEPLMQALEEAGLVEVPGEARPLDKGNWYILGRFWGGAEGELYTPDLKQASLVIVVRSRAIW